MSDTPRTDAACEYTDGTKSPYGTVVSADVCRQMELKLIEALETIEKQSAQLRRLRKRNKELKESLEYTSSKLYSGI